MKPQLRNLIGFALLAIVLAMAGQCWAGAPNLVLDIPSVTATRMEPCVVSASIDWGTADAGESDTANLGGLAWTNTTGSEYTLDVSLRSLSVFPGIYHITEGAGLSDAELSQGTAGALAAGEWDYVNGVLHIRLSDSSNPNSAAGTDITAYTEYTPNQLRILWSYAGTGGSSVSSVPDKYRYCTDPRPGLNNRQIDLTGNDTTNYNRPQGMAWCWPMVQGSWVITAEAVNPSGYTDSASSSTITIAADSRTEYTVQASGGNYTTLAACLADDPLTTGTIIADRDDVKITIEDGHTENFSTMFEPINGDNIYICQAGTGTKPILTYNGTGIDPGYPILFNLCENSLIENIEFATSNNDNSTDNSNIVCTAHINATNTGVIGCKLYGDFEANDLSGLSGGNTINGHLVQNCETEYTRRYSFACGKGPTGGETFNGRILIVGNTFGPSDSESCCRFLYRSSDATVAWNKFTEGGRLDKSSLRLWSVDYVQVYGNYHIDGDFTLGDNIGGANVGFSTHYARIDACYVTGDTDQSLLGGPLEDEVENVVVCNSIVRSSSPQAPLKVRGVNDMCSHNTVWGEDGYTRGLIRSTDANPTNYYTNNLLVHDDKTDVVDSCVYLNTEIGEVNYNTFPSNAASAFAQFDPLTSPTTETSAVNMNTNRVFATGNEEKDVTLDSNYVPSSPTTVTTEPGVYADYFGTARGSTSWVGAVGSQPASESTGLFNTFIPGVLIQQAP